MTTRKRRWAQNLSDPDILNFALGLEHLENAMYRQVNASGKLSGEAADIAKSFGSFEQAHVDALTKALQGANYANIAKEGQYNFPAFDTQDNILKFLNTVEPVGVGAYTGAANLIKDKTILGVAGAIVQVEARQLAITRALGGEAVTRCRCVERDLHPGRSHGEGQAAHQVTDCSARLIETRRNPVADFANDLDILNYALTLEHFESAMYKAIVASDKLTGTEQQYATSSARTKPPTSPPSPTRSPKRMARPSRRRRATTSPPSTRGTTSSSSS